MQQITKNIVLPILALIANLFLFGWLFSEWHISVDTVEGCIMFLSCSLWTLLSIVSIVVIERA